MTTDFECPSCGEKLSTSRGHLCAGLVEMMRAQQYAGPFIQTDEQANAIREQDAEQKRRVAAERERAEQAARMAADETSDLEIAVAHAEVALAVTLAEGKQFVSVAIEPLRFLIASARGVIEWDHE